MRLGVTNVEPRDSKRWHNSESGFAVSIGCKLDKDVLLWLRELHSMSF